MMANEVGERIWKISFRTNMEDLPFKLDLRSACTPIIEKFFRIKFRDAYMIGSDTSVYCSATHSINSTWYIEMRIAFKDESSEAMFLFYLHAKNNDIRSTSVSTKIYLT